MAKDNSLLNVILIDFLVLFEFKTQDNITTKREPINYQHTTYQTYNCIHALFNNIESEILSLS